MTKREKVLQALENCIYYPKLCQNCPWDVDGEKCSESFRESVEYPPGLVEDALALLREQEPKVLEYSEIEKHPLVWLEDNDKEDVIPALFLQYNGWNAEFSVQAHDKYVDTIVRSAIVIAFEKTYGITWRAWTSHPDEQVRRDTPWES